MPLQFPYQPGQTQMNQMTQPNQSFYPGQGAYTIQQMTNTNPYLQPQPQPQPQQQPNALLVEWVRGLAAAESYHAAPGQTAIFLDSLAPAEAPVMYFVSSDQNGRPLPVETYDLVKRVNNPVNQAPAIDLSEYVRKSDIEELVMTATAKAVDQKMSELQFRAAPARNNQGNQGSQGRSDK